MRSLHKFLALNRDDRALLLRAFATVALFRLATRLLSFQQLRRMVDRLSRTRSNSKAADRERVIWALNASSVRVPYGHNCLVRALAAESLLRKNGHDCDFKIGAGKDEQGEFAAHAWLACEGRIIVGDFELGRYVELTRTPITS